MTQMSDQHTIVSLDRPGKLLSWLHSPAQVKVVATNRPPQPVICQSGFAYAGNHGFDLSHVLISQLTDTRLASGGQRQYGEHKTAHTPLRMFSGATPRQG